LEGIAAPGTICLSEQAYWQVKSRLDLAVNDLGSTKLKNIAEPVHVYSLEVGKAALAKATKPAVPKQRSIFVPLAAGIVALIVVAGGAWYFLGANRPATFTSNAPAARSDAAHLSIVVLPFRNLSGDPSQDYFADGITENLTTDLSRIRNSFVIARTSTLRRSARNWACAMSSKGRFSATRTGCASMHNLLMARTQPIPTRLI
jgi:adenylate cyclase